MKKALIAGAAALLLLAAPASAHKSGSKHAKVSTAKLEATDAASAVRGRVQLVDGRKRDKVSLHMKGLEAGQTYTWHVHEGDECRPGTEPAGDFEYRALKARDSGNASSKAKSTSFDSEGGDFFVDVHSADGTVVACGVLESKRHKHKGGKSKDRGHERHDDKQHGRGHERDKDD